MSEQNTDCNTQAAKVAIVSAGSTLLKTGDPFTAVTDFFTTYAAAKGVCEIGKNANNNSGGSKQKE